jgi:hypothetical protein
MSSPSPPSITLSPPGSSRNLGSDECSSPTSASAAATNNDSATVAVSRLAAQRVRLFADGATSPEKKFQLPLSLTCDQSDNMYFICATSSSSPTPINVTSLIL